jgi:hypothetical protein
MGGRFLFAEGKQMAGDFVTVPEAALMIYSELTGSTLRFVRRLNLTGQLERAWQIDPTIPNSPYLVSKLAVIQYARQLSTGLCYLQAGASDNPISAGREELAATYERIELQPDCVPVLARQTPRRRWYEFWIEYLRSRQSFTFTWWHRWELGREWTLGSGHRAKVVERTEVPPPGYVLRRSV